MNPSKDDDEMWNRDWMAQHFDELGPLGQKFASDLLLGATIREATSRHALAAIEASIPWSEMTDFEKCIHRKCREGYERWKNGIGQPRH